MKISSVQIKPIKNGYIVSHYSMQAAEKPARCCDMPCSPGEYVEEFYPDEKVAAKRMAELAKDTRDAK